MNKKSKVTPLTKKEKDIIFKTTQSDFFKSTRKKMKKNLAKQTLKKLKQDHIHEERKKRYWF